MLSSLPNTVKMKEKSDVDSYEGNQSTYLGMGVEKVSDSDCDVLVLDSNDYEDKINHIEFPHGRTRHRNGALTGEGQSISRSALGKLMRIARIARPGAIYDDSAAARTSPKAELSKKMKKLGGEIPEIEDLTREKKTISGICLDLRNSYRENKCMLIRRTF